MKKATLLILQMIIIFTIIAPCSVKALSNYRNCNYSININDKEYDLVYQISKEDVILPFSEEQKINNNYIWIHNDNFKDEMLTKVNAKQKFVCPILMAEKKDNVIKIYTEVKNVDLCDGVCTILQNKKDTRMAASLANISNSILGKTEHRLKDNCETILGDPNDEEDVAWLINKMLSYIKIIGPIIVIIFSSIDYLRALIQSDSETMAKLNKKLITRIVLVILLFFLPTLVNAVLALFGLVNSSSCRL